MKRLGHRFRWFRRALRMYPRSYYRRYASQTLQTLADMIDDPGLRRSARIKIHIGAWLDLCRSVPKQRLIAATRKAARQPGKYLGARSVMCLSLLVPLAVSIISSRVDPPATSPAGIYDSPLLNLWYGKIGVVIWAIVLPIWATILALYVMCTWYFARQRHKNRSRRKFRGTKLSLGLIGTVGIVGTVLLTYAAGYNIMDTRRSNQEIESSQHYQQQHPTLACTLLPLATAKIVLGSDQIYMNNNFARSIHPYSGLITDTPDERITMCQYHQRNGATVGIITTTHETFSSAAQNKMHDNFSAQKEDSYWQPISLFGYEGFFNQQPLRFSISLWVKGFWVDVTASNFDPAHVAMKTIIDNLDNELALRSQTDDATDNHQVVPLPAAEQVISKEDQDTIVRALPLKEPSITAGTTYDVHFTTLAGNQVSGTVQYQTGKHGSFTATRKQGTWAITGYTTD